MQILRTIAGNLATLAMAFVIAAIIWVNAEREANPDVTQSFQVRLQRIDRPDGIILSQSNQTVQVFASAPESIMNELTSADFEAILDLTTAAFGNNVEVPVTVNPLLEGVAVEFFTPTSVTFDLDQIETREIPVTVDVRGSAATNFELGEAAFEPATIQVTGPAEQVNQIENVVVTVDVDGASEPVMESLAPQLVNERGVLLSRANLTLSDTAVSVTVPVMQRSGVREKDITVVLEGTPAEGYLFVSQTVTPDTVVVTGSASRLDAIQRLETTSIDISGLRETTVFTPTLVIPPGITLQEATTTIQVEIVIEPVRVSAFLEHPIDIRNLAEELTATLDTDTVRLVAFGPIQLLDELDDDDFIVTVDLFGRDVGEYQIPPTITPVDPNIEIRSYSPEFINVVIEPVVIEPVTDTVTTTSSLDNGLPRLTLAPPATGPSGIGAGLLAIVLPPAALVPAGLAYGRRWKKE